MKKNQEAFPFYKKNKYPITFQSIEVVRETKLIANPKKELLSPISDTQKNSNDNFKLKLYKSICNINLK